MLEKDPSNYEWFTYAWVILISMWGGVVSFMNKVTAGSARPFNLAEFIGEISTSGFVGVLTFWLCESTQVDKLLSAALVGVAGHMGSRAIFLIERRVENWLSLKEMKND